MDARRWESAEVSRTGSRRRSLLRRCGATGRFRRSPRSIRFVCHPAAHACMRVRANQVGQWKGQAVEGLADMFSRGRSLGIGEVEMKDLRAKIGRLAVENEFFVARAREMSPVEKKSMIDRGRADLSVSRRCRLLKLSRSSL